MKQNFTKLRENMIDYRRQYNKTHKFINNHYSDVDITDEIEKPKPFENIKIIAYMNIGYIHSITFFNIPCNVSNLIKNNLNDYNTFYATQGINTNWKLINHSSLIYEIEKIEHNNYDRVSLDVYIKIACLNCNSRLNQQPDIFTIGKWFNIRNIDYYKRLLEHTSHHITKIDETKIYLEIIDVIKNNLQPGDILNDYPLS